MRGSVAAAVLLSAAAHAGVIAWGVSGLTERTMAVDAGATAVIEVTLVQGPATGGAAGAGGKPATPRKRPQPPAAADPAPEPTFEPTPEPAKTVPTTDRAVAADHIPQAVATAAAAVGPPPTATPKADDAPEAAPVPPQKPAAPAAAEAPSDSEPAPPTAENPRRPQVAALPHPDHTARPAAVQTDDDAGRETDGSIDEGMDESMGGGASGGAAEGAAPRADNPAPAYPYAARRRGQEGRVVLEVEVLADGGAGAVAVARSSGVASLDRAAVDAVRRWRFRPARRNGRTVRSTVRVPVRFALH
jgi:protein TonB